MRRAARAPSNVYAYSRSGAFWVRAASSPAVVYVWRTRATVASPTSSAPAIAASVQPGPPSPWSAFKRMRAWVGVRAAAIPLPISVRRRARSPSLSSTTSFFAIVASSAHRPPARRWRPGYNDVARYSTGA